MLIKALCALALPALMGAASASAQTPGEWRYTIATDPSNIPADMRVNFPTITFSACRSAEDFASGRAFALQTLASSAARCPSTDFVRTPVASANRRKAESLSFVFACDDGKTLVGSAIGRVSASDFKIALESRYLPAVNGIRQIKQTMTSVRTGACKTQPVVLIP